MFSKLKYLRSAGFTMIELLVVIAVIGVLAVAVLSSINPIEQINKGRDTRSRSDAAQLISAVDRYFAIHEKYPWNENGVLGADDTYADGWTYDSATSGLVSSTKSYESTDYRSRFEFYEPDAPEGDPEVRNPYWSWTIPLVTTAEVKESYGNRIAKVEDNTNFLVVKPEGANRTMYVCFNPSSYAFDLESSSRCDRNSDSYDSQLAETDVPEACPNDGTTDCWDDLSDENKCMICLP